MKLVPTGPVALDLPRSNHDKVDHHFRRSSIFRPLSSPGDPANGLSSNSNCDTDPQCLDRQTSDDVEEEEVCRQGLHAEPHDSSNQATRISHSEIEKRRRNKLNAYIRDLSLLVPLCQTMHSRKLDKLTILKMSVNHLRNVNRQSSNKLQLEIRRADGEQVKTRSHDGITPEDLRQLCLSMSDGFLLVLECSSGAILHVSETSEFLLQSTVLLTGANFFDLIYPADLTRVRQQLTQSGGLIDQDQVGPAGLSFQQPFAQRSFSCRILRSRSLTQGRIRMADHSGHYVSLSITGFIKSLGESHQGSSRDHGSRSSEIFVALTQILSTADTPVSPSHHYNPETSRTIPEFSCRLSPEARYTAIDPETSTVLGYSLQEIHGSSIYRICHHEDIAAVSESHRAVVSRGGPSTTLPYRLLDRRGQYVTIVTYWQAFRNPLTRIVEAILARSRVVHCHSISMSPMCLRIPRSLNEYPGDPLRRTSDPSTAESTVALASRRGLDGFMPPATAIFPTD